jgi:ATP-dependent exoDNAse (exonuclease V) beta subunit
MNKSQIIAVQSSAGSGKTYNLAKRYIYLLFDPDNDISTKNIVAITFTNKAVIEMKYRIINFLKNGALSLSTNGFFSDLKLTKDEISKKSIIVLKNILESYDSFNVSTIDSFKNRILKACAININIPPHFTIEQDYSANLLFSLEKFLKKSQESESLRDLLLLYLSQYLMTNSGWIPISDIYKEIKKVFNKAGNTGKDIYFAVTTSNYTSEFSSKVKTILGKIKKFSEILPKLQIYSSYNKAVKCALYEGDKLFFSMQVPIIFAKENLQYKKTAEVNSEADVIWREISIEIKSLYDFYMKNYYAVYSYIYSKVILEFDIQSKKDGVVFLNEINKKTVSFFEKNNSIIPEVYYRLSERYKHFLIDEFQDTSFVQWVGIKKILEESLAAGGTFFYVGDIKQAIYAFRGAKPELFNEVSNEFPSICIEKHFFEQNFRSGKNIVDFNNDIFSKKNIERFLGEVYRNTSNNKYDFSKFTTTYAFSNQQAVQKHNYGYVEISILNKKCENVKEKIKQKFMRYIFELLERFDPKNIAVLCRSNDEIFDVSLWLLENGLEVESSQTLNIKNNTVIKQIMSLFMFINSPINALAFSSFIMGDIFSKISNIESNEFEKFIFIYNKNSSIVTENFYNVFKDKYKNLWEEYFEDFFKKAGFVSVYELLLAILEKFKIMEYFTESKAFIMCLLEFVKEFETRDFGLKNFLEYFMLSNNTDLLYLKGVFGNGIKVMTIHKSKGLQFPVVIIPFLQLSEAKIDIPYFDDSGEEIKILKISKNIANFSQKAKNIYDTVKLNALLSELNMLYVAMTRAEHELYIIIPQKTGTANNRAFILFENARHLISGVKQKYNINNIINSDVILDTFNKNYKSIRKYFISEKKRIFNITDAAIRGTIIHYALSTIISLEKGNITNTINNAVESAKRKFFFENVDFVKKKLQKLFLSQEILRLFMYNKDKVYNEKEIVNVNGESFRVDKLIITDNEVVIVDFKSSNYNKVKTQNQLNVYCDLISEIYQPKKVSVCIVDIDKRIVEKL